ncbi:LysE family translocator [Aliamphritea ceti]|uniref:LysE family translocator n=1 Tax=Aliamphritea ceti TaxID=1524258 RepID=UPI0021C25BBB|nr:LysE family translocator [Aliamphritea ceti]
MFDTTQILAYATALAIAALIPGPGMTTLIARSVSGGAVTGFCVLSGLILGDLIYLSFAVFGLALIAEHLNTLFIVIRWASALYLSYLAWQFWFAEHQSLDIQQKVRKKDLISAGMSGLTITLGNPKTIAFYLALLPLVIQLDAITLQSWGLVLLPVTVLVLLSIGAVYIAGAIRIRRFLSQLQAQRLLFRSAAVMMLSAAGLMLSRSQ